MTLYTDHLLVQGDTVNIIQKALSDLYYTIPPEVLEMAFMDRQAIRQGLAISLEHRIREKVIDGRVIPDCNIRGGKQLEVPLDGLPVQRHHNGMHVYHIPKDRTDGCSITSVLSVTYGSYGAYGNMSGRGYYNHQSDLSNVAAGVLSSAESPGHLSSASVQLIGENILLVKSLTPMPGNAFVRCNVEHDAALSNIAPASWPVFSDMVQQATKAYIYIHKRVMLDQGFLHGGINLGAIGDFVDEYADANELYQEILREKWGRVTHANDPERMRRTMALQIGINR